METLDQSESRIDQQSDHWCDVIEKFYHSSLDRVNHDHTVVCSCSDWNKFMKAYIKFRSLQFNRTHLRAAHQTWIVKLSHEIGYNFNPTPVRVTYLLSQAITWYNNLNVPKMDYD